MHNLSKKVGYALRDKAISMATAESCTGGWIAQEITSIPGSSAWFDSGFVTYSNQAKQRMLGVSAQTLQIHGAVSEQVVVEMVEGALKNSDAAIAVAVSGIAGPDGGSKEKPVGTVWLAWARHGYSVVTARFCFSGDRKKVRQQAVEKALEGILTCLIN